MAASPTSAMRVTSPVGETIRLARTAARLKQAEVGARIGYSASAVSRIENGRLIPDLDTLRALCVVLRIPPERVGLAPAGATPDTPRLAPGRTGRVATGSVMADAAKEDPVRRREFLTGTAVAMGAAVLGGSAGAAASTSETSLAAGLNRVLFRGVTDPPGPVSVAKVRTAVALAREDYRAARYAALAGRLPELIALAQTSRDAATGQAREQVTSSLADAYSIATEWCVKLNQDALALVTSDRALSAARDSGDPTAIGEAARITAIAIRHAGHYDSALDLLTATADDLNGHRHDPQAVAVAGSLLLTGAYSAAQAGHRAAALELVSEAEQTAARMRRPAMGGLFTTDFGPDQCALYRISVHHALGDDTGAVAYADNLDINRLPTAERQARYCLDVARAYHNLGKPERVYQALLAAERLAPEDVRRPSMRTLAAELLYAPGHLPGLRQFATRIGAVA